MGNDKTAEAGGATLINTGKRTYDLGPAESDEKKSPRQHRPGTTFFYSASELVRMAPYVGKELMDITKLPGQVDVRKLKEENARLLDENRRLREQVAALPDGSEKAE